MNLKKINFEIISIEIYTNIMQTFCVQIACKWKKTL